MYAKLVYSAGLSGTANTRYSAFNMIRDIVRLCTSDSPNVTNLVAFSNTSSVIVDTTPAGWSLVYSDVDGTTLPDANTDTNASPSNQVTYWAIKSDCIGPYSGVTKKYAKLTTSHISSRNSYSTNGQASSGFSLTSAVEVTDVGTVTGEGYRLQYPSGTPSNSEATNLAAWDLSGNGTYHVVATQRHLTIIKEDAGYHAVWEHSVSDYHTFYDIAPVISIVFKGTTVSGPNSSAPASTAPATGGIPNAINNVRCLHNITDVNTGTNYSAASMSAQENQPYLSISSSYSNLRTVSTTGTTRNIVMPIMFQLMQWGIPTCFVTNICDIYMCQGGIGMTGDTFNINDIIYTYFDCGSIGLAIGTF
jgi:hypothetical protein